MSAGIRGTRGLPKARVAVDAVAGGAALLDETFSVDSALNAYVANSGTSKAGLACTGGLLVSTNGADHMFNHPSVAVADAKHIVRVVPGASSARTIYLMAKYIDDNNSLFLQEQADASFLFLYRVVAGVTTYVTLATPSAASGAPFWMVIRVSGNWVAAESHKLDPRLGAAPFSSNTMQLTSTAATVLGAGVVGKPGLRLAGASTDWKLDDWMVVSSPVRSAF